MQHRRRPRPTVAQPVATPPPSLARALETDTSVSVFARPCHVPLDSSTAGLDPLLADPLRRFRHGVVESVVTHPRRHGFPESILQSGAVRTLTGLPLPQSTIFG